MGEPEKKTIRLYNVYFPIYMAFLFFPATWLLALPVNFAVDSAVLILAARHSRCEGLKGIWKKGILRVWLFGFLADIAGAALITVLYIFLAQTTFNLFRQWYVEILMAVPGVALAGWLIYILDKKWALKKTGLDPESIRKIAFALAVFTVPYTMLIPMALIY